ncbi:MAG: hydroxymethylpyrimidine/phosphomethylpyrimidine kinase [Burkholderiaceae bacterium]|jgi:hydroxymethylpyrimidine/phosphomethylpyrimidine kinase|nr:hydroxymethylpyrimidine/phosphomethylpyrimidine kinase [Burkholderiaceae bacterium]
MMMQTGNGDRLSPPVRAGVLVFAGLDSSGGAGLQADIEAIGAVGAHALPIATVLTVQDNDRVFAVHPVDVAIWRHQADVLIEKMPIAAIKIGAIGNRANAEALAILIVQLRKRQPELPVVLDTVLGSGHGDLLTEGRAEHAVMPLIPLATLVTPNLPEAARLSPGADSAKAQTENLLALGSRHVLLKGGHGNDTAPVLNRWFTENTEKSWTWPRLEGTFHGSGCTLASLFAGLLAQGIPMGEALEKGQAICQEMLAASYAIARGQRIPDRHVGRN